MPNTYSQIYIQIVFAVKHRESLIHESIREQVEKYITGIITNKNQKLIAIYCNPDHIHILVGLKPSISISDLVRDIKVGSSNYIRDNKLVRGKFNWQDGFGAFSYSRSNLDNVVKYILNQADHHKQKTFKEEYIDFLEKFEIEYDNKYLFEWII